MPSEKVFKLSRPIKVHGAKGAEDLTEIALREPTADEVFDFDLPFRTIFDPAGKTAEQRMDGKALRAWIERLSGRGREVIGQLAARDVRGIYDWLFDELNVADEDGDARKN